VRLTAGEARSDRNRSLAGIVSVMSVVGIVNRVVLSDSGVLLDTVVNGRGSPMMASRATPPEARQTRRSQL